MPINLTDEEVATLQAQYIQLTSSIASRQAAIDAQNNVVQDATNADNAEKKVFAFYDDAIIRQYEDEREELDGTYQDDPVTTTDLDAVGALDATNRLFPTLPDTEPVRISQFDGGNLITTDNEILDEGITVVDHEAFRITKQLQRQNWLVNGFGGTSPTIDPTAIVLTPIDINTTLIEIEEDPTGTSAFAIGDRFIIEDGSQQVAVEVLSITPTGAGTCSDPTYTDEATCTLNGEIWTPTSKGFELGIRVITDGNIAANSNIDENWSGFSNTDRANKNDATDGYNHLLTTLIDALEEQIDFRLGQLTTQKAALETNEDPALDPNALINVDTVIAFLNAWKVDRDVDDTEIASLTNECNNRNIDITSRIAAITAAIATQVDARYTSAVNIADTSRGTARIKIFRIDTQGVTGDLKASDEAQRDAIENTLILAGEEVPTI